MLHSIINGLAKSLAGLAMGGVVVSAAFADDIVLNLPQNVDDPVLVAVPDGFVAEPVEALQVFVGSAEGCCEDRIPLAGSYARESNLLSFAPAFGFDAGTDYVARVQGPQRAELAAFSIASEDTATPAAVTQIYPSGDVLPENILRFYIHFSVPMMPGVAYDYIKLRDASGAADEAAFMRFKQELWNNDRTRLTVLIDPGRIKRDVATNRELGPALIAGNRYSLSVDGGWPTANGQSELAAFSKSFSVAAAIRERPDVGLWQTTSPCVGTNEPLALRFDRPFDRHLLERDIQVIAGDEHVVKEKIEIGRGERSWHFVPKEPWPSGELLIIVNSKLEDIAANNFRDLLDHVQGDAVAPARSIVRSVGLRSCY